MRLFYINYLEAGKRRSSISGFLFIQSTVILLCFVLFIHKLPKMVRFGEDYILLKIPFFFFGFNFVVIFFRNLTLFDFLSQTSTILLHTQVTAVMNNHVETLKTVLVMQSGADANLKLRGSGFVSLALPAFFSSAIFLIGPNKERGGGRAPLPLLPQIRHW